MNMHANQEVDVIDQKLFNSGTNSITFMDRFRSIHSKHQVQEHVVPEMLNADFLDLLDFRNIVHQAGNLVD